VAVYIALGIAGGEINQVQAQGASGQKAAAQGIQFNIPAQGLGSALTSFADRAGLKLLFPSSLVAGKSSPGLSGQLSRQQGLSRLLAGTGLSYQFTSANTVTIIDPSAGGNGAAATVPGAIALDTIDVSGGGAAAADEPYQTPGSVNHISEEEIQRFPGNTTGDIFKGTPGVISGMNRNGAAVDVNIRGMQGMNRVATTVDGSEASTSTWRGYYGVDSRTYVDPDLIGGVTVTKGPNDGSPGAIGGTVAMETLNAADILKPGDSYGVRVKGSLASDEISPIVGTSIERTDEGTLFERNSGSASVAFAARSDNVDVVAAVARRKAGNYFAGTNGPLTYTDYLGSEKELSSTKYGEEVFNTSQDVTSYLLKGTVRLGDGQELKLGYSRYENTFGEITPLLLAVNGNHLERQVPLSGIALDRMTARYSWKPADNDLIDFKLNTWMSNTEEESVYSVYINSYSRYLQTKNYGVEASNASRFDFASMPFTLRYGASYALEDAAPMKPSDPASGLFPTDGTREIGSVFLNGKWEATPWLALDAGVRYLTYQTDNRGATPLSYAQLGRPPYTGYEGDGASPSFGITLTPFDGWQIFGKYTTGIRPPSLRESTYTNSALVFNPDLQAEKSRNWEFGTNYLGSNLLVDGDTARLKFAYFDNTYDDYIGRKAVNFSVLSLFNYDKVQMKGFELSGGYDAKRAFVDFAFNYYTDVISCPTAGKCVDYTLQSDYLANQIPPKFTTSVTAGLRFFDEKLTVGSRVNFVGERAGQLVPDPTYFFMSTVWNPYTVVDAFAQWKASEELTFDLSAENLFDRYYMDALNNSALPSPGRTIRAGLTAKFGSSEPFPRLWPTDLFSGESVREGDWTGFYLGAHVGHGFGENARDAISLTGASDAMAAREFADYDLNNVLGGGQFGFNYQFENRLVLGVEGDFSWLGYEGYSEDVTTESIYLERGQLASKVETSLDWLTTLRGRVGYAVNDSLMVYATGGAAFLKQTEERTQYNLPDTYASKTVPSFMESVSPIHTGVALGGGLEYSIGGGWSLKAEYLYAGFANKDITFRNARSGVGRDTTTTTGGGFNPGLPGCVIPTNIGACFEPTTTTTTPGTHSGVSGRKVENDIDLHSAKIGLNYRF
jgi:hemoglobin/transferrin/lactoferrin receptor protein